MPLNSVRCYATERTEPGSGSAAVAVGLSSNRTETFPAAETVRGQTGGGASGREAAGLMSV